MKPPASEGTIPMSRFYRPELDVLRLFAFLLVFLRHSLISHSPFTTVIVLVGQSGVCVFFLLSAYLITELLDRELSRTGGINLFHFYIRRILRIWPLYFAALLLGWLIDRHSPVPQLSGPRMLAYLLLAGNWYTARHGMPASFVGVLWSVSVEEQFYLVWPSLRKRLSRKAAIHAGFAALPISYCAIFWLCHHEHAGNDELWVNTLVQAQFFALGCLLALLLRGRAPRWSGPVRLLLFALGLVAFFASQYYLPEEAYTLSAGYAFLQYLLTALGAVMFFLSVLGLSALGRYRPLVELGKISYGLYVFHILAYRLTERLHNWLAMHFATSGWLLQTGQVLGSLALTIVMAALSYRYLETPFLRLKDRFAAVHSRPV
jgi:peptidoglycan/LPS O-acetylase OafA/YrhL